MGIDEKCIQLAQHFLGEGQPQERVKSLAEDIQSAVDAWFLDREDATGELPEGSGG